MDDRERKRQESIFEFIATESSYVRDLQLIVGVFYARVMTLLPDKALHVIFANVEDILMLNTFFLSALEDRQKESRLYVDTIGDVLAEHCQNLEVYMPYCVNQDVGAKLLVQLRGENAELERALVEIRGDPSVRGLDLSSYLLEPSEYSLTVDNHQTYSPGPHSVLPPSSAGFFWCLRAQLTSVQRVTRYPLLLKQIAKYTTPDQDLADVQKALALTETTVARINEDVRDAEGRERLRVLSEDLWVGGEG